MPSLDIKTLLNSALMIGGGLMLQSLWEWAIAKIYDWIFAMMQGGLPWLEMFGVAAIFTGLAGLLLPRIKAWWNRPDRLLPIGNELFRLSQSTSKLSDRVDHLTCELADLSHRLKQLEHPNNAE